MLMSKLAQNVSSSSQMASNPSAAAREKLRKIENLQSVVPDKAARSRSLETLVDPFAKLAASRGRPLKIAIVSDFTRIPYANGAVFQTRFLYHELTKAGHQVTLIGPADPETRPGDLPPGTVELPSVPLKTYPGLYIPVPTASWIFDPDRWDFDLCFAQATTLVLEFALWLRKVKGIPVLCVNTTHLTAAYDVLLPEAISKIPAVHAGVDAILKRPCDRLFKRIYNESDGLVVLSDGLRRYWRERGVTVPIHVIPRVVQPEVFDKGIGDDPYRAFLPPGEAPRLLCAGRHTREKSQDRVIRIFARCILPQRPDATLTLLGKGPDTELYKRVAVEEGCADRVFFPGEVPFTKMTDYYAHADIFVHTSLSETYGNVMGEALYCGTPVVAFSDGMGVTAQIDHNKNGVLLEPGRSMHGDVESDRAFGEAVLSLLADPERRASLGKAAARRSRDKCSPHAVKTAMVAAFDSAELHMRNAALQPLANMPAAARWAATARHARSWGLVNGTIYCLGFLRPANNATPSQPTFNSWGKKTKLAV